MVYYFCTFEIDEDIMKIVKILIQIFSIFVNFKHTKKADNTLCHLSTLRNQKRFSSLLLIPMFIGTPCSRVIIFLMYVVWTTVKWTYDLRTEVCSSLYKNFDPRTLWSMHCIFSTSLNHKVLQESLILVGGNTVLIIANTNKYGDSPFN